MPEIEEIVAETPEPTEGAGVASQEEQDLAFSRSERAWRWMMGSYVAHAAVIGSKVHEVFPSIDLLESANTHLTEMSQVGFGYATMGAGIALLAYASRGLRDGVIRPEENFPLVTDGIRSVVRHPNYIGMRGVSLGATIMLPSVESLVTFAGTLLATERTARAEDRHLEASRGDSFRQYRARTPAWIPGGKKIEHYLKAACSGLRRVAYSRNNNQP